jgi:CheY-like chemotaxis protein
MNHKVLLADDSLTIQKVIKITLANEPYDITEASSEDELFQKLSSLDPKIVFLDFNLSEKFSGYELTSKIKKIHPSVKVLLLLGTFDTVDDASMEKCGASDKIIKPFDSNKFIAICRQLIETFQKDEHLIYPEIAPKVELTADNQALDEQWTLSHTTQPVLMESSPPHDQGGPSLENALLKEVFDWGMSIPGVIDGGSSEIKTAELPPVISEEPSKRVEELNTQNPISSISIVQDNSKYPANEDLDYPTIEELSSSSRSKSSSTESPKTTSKLIPIDQFKEPVLEIEIGEDNQNVIDDETTGNIRSLQEQIQDEVADDLWLADEFEDLKKEVSAKIEEVKSNFQPTINDFDESLFKPIDDNESLSWNDSPGFNAQPEIKQQRTAEISPAINADQLRIEMEVMVKKYVKEYLDQMFQKNAEKIAWEVIPDLAENLIRQELTKISSKILNE